MENTLSAALRDDTGSRAARRLRREGKIPAICYGTGRDTFKISLDPDELRYLLQHSPQGRNTVIDLQAGGDSHRVMVQDIQRDPVKRVPVHVDFRLIKEDDRVMVDVPVHYVGRSSAEETGGRIQIIQRTVILRCAVKDIPEGIELDVSELVLGDRIKASEIVAPPGTEVFFKSDYVVLTAARPRGLDEDEETGVEDEEEEEDGVEVAVED